jgi:glycine/D-amino acid oxidase-like deaminating enzyme
MIDIDDNRAPWVADLPPYEARAPLAGEVRADVAIVGGGFTGVSTALHLSRRFPDRRVVLLEARLLANGASGRNGGHVLNFFNGAEPADPARVRRLYEVTNAAIDDIEATLRSAGVDAGFAREGSLEVYTSAERAEAAHARAERHAAAGVPLRFLSGGELSSRLNLEGAVGGVLDPGAGRMNGAAYLRGLRRVLLERGVGVFENTPVLAVREGRAIELATPGGAVRADAVVLATNAYTPALGYFRGRVLPLHCHMLGTERRAPETWASLGWGRLSSFSDDSDRIAFGALTETGRLVFGGGCNAAYAYRFGGRATWPAGACRGHDAVAGRLRRYLPLVDTIPVEHRWTGPVALTLDRQPTIGVRGEHRNVYYALGYSGHGVTLANLAGRVLADLYAGDAEQWTDLPCFERVPPYMPPEPFTWLGYTVWTKLTGRSPRRR